MVVSTRREQPAPEPPASLGDDDGDRPSITETNGSIARFEMAYNPREGERFAFGPPLWQRAPSYAFFLFSLVLALAVVGGTHAPSNSPLFRWVAERPAAPPLSLIIFLCGLGTIVRTSLRGVIVSREGIETRDLVAGFPRVRRWNWSQVDRLVVDDESVLLELWDGTYERLPKVRDARALVDLLVRVGTARGRQITRLAAR